MEWRESQRSAPRNCQTITGCASLAQIFDNLACQWQLRGAMIMYEQSAEARVVADLLQRNNRRDLFIFFRVDQLVANSLMRPTGVAAILSRVRSKIISRSN